MAHRDFLTLKQIGQLYDCPDIKDRIDQNPAGLPAISKKRFGAIGQKGLPLSQCPVLGERFGFFSTFENPLALAVFTTKGGVLKSTLSLNIARVAALHNIKTCVVGLDIQGDVTRALGQGEESENSADNLDNILAKLDSIRGLFDYFSKDASITDLICPTDLPTLDLIPETPELVALNDSLTNINRREYWIREKVIAPLKRHYDLIIMDCSPNWNKLTTNALVGCDALISPLECKINNFRNFKVFWRFLDEFREDMRLDFETIFIPTKFSSNKKLGQEIRQWYQENIQGCTSGGVKESVAGEEATALNLSVVEHALGKPASQEMIELLKEVRHRLNLVETRQSERPDEIERYAAFYGRPSNPLEETTPQ